MLNTFEFEGLSIRYHRQGKGEPMVFLHNGGTSHAIWDDLLPRLDGYECFALDLLGFGASSKPASGYELDRHVAILGAFIDAHGLGAAHLVGNCMGSATALAFALRRPDAVRSMVLFNVLTPATLASGLYAPMLSVARHAPAMLGGLSKIALGARLGKLGVRSQLGRAGVARRVHQRPELCACYDSASQSRSLLAVLADLPSYAMLDDLQPPPGFPPFCTVWGLENRVLRAKQGQALVRTLKPARQEWLEGCGHLPMLEEPERCAQIVRSFCGDFAARSAA